MTKLRVLWAVMTAVAIVALPAPSATAAPANTVTIAAAHDGRAGPLGDCLKTFDPPYSEDGILSITRTGSTAVSLTVSFTLTREGHGPTDRTATIPAGRATTPVSVDTDAVALTTVTGAIQADASYEVGSPSSATLVPTRAVQTEQGKATGIECMVHPRHTETIEVGGKPTYPPPTATGSSGEVNIPLIGTEPPGLDWNNYDGWTRAATHVGTYQLNWYYCLSDICFDQTPVTIEVVPAGSLATTVPATTPTEPPPATPVRAPATFTG